MDGVLSQEEINALLNNNNAADSSDEILTESEKDAIGEIANISMGTAATTLFSLVNRRACEKTKVFSCVLLLIDTTVVIFYKKVYTPPFPIRMLLWNPMRQLRLFSVYCDIYKDCVQ